MELKANVNFNRFEAALQVVDAHTEGEFCRMVIGGFPEPQGNTMIEKKKWMEEKLRQCSYCSDVRAKRTPRHVWCFPVRASEQRS